ncbi:acetyl-CoA carboxylase [Thecamonas trahens ATCC 50062]|uniref:Acetyl-CoA carboxylase n=1 Tax=Thecamonas trahens ATCC 50062 TaxID=461836 RepID=A0A0L0DL93_THETB|nr:acetyl-CoA carboxylase [Thecamonas trahens ATCC 50062]KNC52811.1 acetyl-CoA carboxylase [Thecamonas trahens ATCC 50062]|eukprot:XP_013755120.1 acetyl-CoA carboxylase [Thecamonas trahens ATCC 50062]
MASVRGPALGTYPDVESYVKAKGGSRVIRKCLVANNGIAAVKTIRSVRDWAYTTFGSESAIQFVVMVTPEDLAANAAYIRMAEEAIEVPGGTNNNNYANVDQIVDVAIKAGVDAVFAGWGHASENPKLPDALDAAGIVFIGPSGDAMRALGDKIASTIVAQSVDVPCLPWSGDSLQLPEDSAGATTVPADLLAKACVTSAADASDAAERIGYPVMIKASEGGGGKGIRMVQSADTVVDAFRQVAAEVPGSPIFIMKLAPSARHLEVQLLCDMHGNAMSLFGRDCSMQRRHQKVLEEGPVTVATVDQQIAMEAAAVRLAKQVNYVSAGTVEYLYFDDAHFFLELNPRLQVEHPVTEMITGVSIPASQLQVAMGIPLFAIPEIRVFYGLDPNETAPFDLSARPEPSCAVIAARITAENAEEGFKPTSGLITDLSFASTTNVWGYFSVSAGSSLHEYSDSQFGHLFASGPPARTPNVVIRGEIRTPVEYLANVLETPEFVDNTFSTAWLDARIRSGLLHRTVNLDEVFCGALARVHAAATKRANEFEAALARGQIPPLSLLDNNYAVTLIFNSVKYELSAVHTAKSSYALTLNGATASAELVELVDGTFLVHMDGKTHTLYAREEASGLRIVVNGRTCVFSDEFDPSLIRSLTPGKIVKFLVDDNSHVAVGEPIAHVEVMKMIMPMAAPAAGVISFSKSEGSILAPGMVIATLDLDDVSAVERASPYDGAPPAFGPPRPLPTKPHKELELAAEVIAAAFDGYSPSNLSDAVALFVKALGDPKLALCQVSELLASIESRLPDTLFASLTALLDSFEAAADAADAAGNPAPAFPANELLAAIDATEAGLAPKRSRALPHASGASAYAVSRVKALMDQYISVETQYGQSNTRREEVLWDLRDENKDDVDRVVGLARSHSGLENKNAVLGALLACVAELRDCDLPVKPRAYVSIRGATSPSARAQIGCVEDYQSQLEALASFTGKGHARLALASRVLLIHANLPSFAERKAAMGELLASVAGASPDEHHGLLTRLVDRPSSLSDVLVPFFTDPATAFADLALKAYIIRTYRAYDVLEFVPVVPEGVESLVAAVAFHFNLPVRKSRPMTPSSRNSSASSMDAASVSATSSSGHLATRTSVAGFHSSPSMTAISEMASLPLPSPSGNSGEHRYGVMYAVNGGMDALYASADALLAAYTPPAHTLGFPASSPLSFVNIINFIVAVEGPLAPGQAEAAAAAFGTFLQDAARSATLRELCVRRITLGLVVEGSYPVFFTYRGHLEYAEDGIHRYIEPPLAFQLDIGRLSNYNIRAVPTGHSHLHVYAAHAKGAPAGTAERIFVRSIVRDPESFTAAATVDLLATEGERILVDALDAIQMINVTHPNLASADSNHIFINLLPNMVISLDEVRAIGARFVQAHGRRMFQLRVMETELKLNLQFAGSPDPDAFVPVRIQIKSRSGFVVRYHVYVETLGDAPNGTPIFTAISQPGALAEPAPWNGLPISTPYALPNPEQAARRRAQNLDTVYIYDFPEVMDQAVRQVWGRHVTAVVEAGEAPPTIPAVCCEATEYRLGADGKLAAWPNAFDASAPPPRIGMVAWKCVWYTPECPAGRVVVVVGNDITCLQGSFGPAEDELFFQASAMARSLGVPRVYLSANSGARIGMAEELRAKFKVAWLDSTAPERGAEYLYLELDDAAELGNDVVHWEEVDGPDGTRVARIVDIIGTADGIGVENLRASGMIAGETSLAYEDVFTISLVSGRSVGIGAYLVRLGQRIVQHKSPPILLTGAGALNKLLGSQVYTSNNQLGGIKIMHANGVSHLVCENNLDGVRDIVKWISYVPAVRDGPLPCLPSPVDGWDRDIAYTLPPSGAADPRAMLAGASAADGWVSGFFDRDSFVETLAGWARTVVTGRARLGGMPVGVIAVETRSVTTVAPADPGDKTSQEMVYPEAGQVWYPNSASKTAQAINDFNFGEQLPLFIFANWRGFSGGMRDMFNEVLKFGSHIVDALRKYKQPISIYIPPNGELRGGAWVVLDTTINADMIEMYASESARGGILEPAGAVEIKYKERHLRATMLRLDDECKRLAEELAAADAGSDAATAAAAALTARQDDLMPYYRQVAVQFADLHDTPGRMLAKGVVKSVVPWRNARRFFYWRMSRRVGLHGLARKLVAGNAATSYAAAVDMLHAWIAAAGVDLDNDRAVAEYVAIHRADLDARVSTADLAVARGLAGKLRTLLAGLSDDERAAVMAELN